MNPMLSPGRFHRAPSPRRVLLLLAATLSLLCAQTGAKAGPEIPKPRISISDAVHKAEEHFLSGPAEGGLDQPAFRRECIVVSAIYTAEFERSASRIEDLDERSWVVTLVHPRHNDHRWVFQVRGNGAIKLLQR